MLLVASVCGEYLVERNHSGADATMIMKATEIPPTQSMLFMFRCERIASRPGGGAGTSGGGWGRRWGSM